jgi:alpha-mannosidase
MKIRYLLLLFLLIASLQIQAQLTVFRTINEKQIKVKASSSWSGSVSPMNLIDLSGMQGLLHDNEMSASTMWHTGSNPVTSRANAGTHPGPAWILFEFDRVYSLNELLIWNHNQPEYTKRGLKNVILEYSEDGKNWAELKPQGSSCWIIPEASARNGEPVNLAANLAGISARYFTITATTREGNYGDEIYGLSEVLFVTSEKLKLNQSIALKGTDKIYQGVPPTREIDLEFNQGIGYGSDTIHFIFQGKTIQIPVNPGGGPIKQIPTRMPYVPLKTSTNLIVTDRLGSFKKSIYVDEPKQWTIHLIAQSHVDIGYTDYPDKVSLIYNKNIKNAIELAKKTEKYPEGSRFRWNMEVLWPVEKYLNQASPQERNDFTEAVKKGWINLDAAYASINTSLCNGEQLNRLFEYGDTLEKKMGIHLDATQQVDVPGASWGIVEAMKQSGVKFFLDLPNYMDDNLQENNPFFWMSPSATSSILHFQTYYYNLGYHLKGRYIPNYLQGNTDPVYKENPDQYFLDPFIFGFLDGLKKKGYPYSQLPLAWTMTDNAALDPDLPDVVKRWNEKYINPKILISTPTDFYHDLQSANKAQIPVRTGDYTEYWTNGVASGAMETRANRHNTEDIIQLETLFALSGRKGYDPDFFSYLWKQIILFTEHTWGSYKSATDFSDPYVYGQWKVKADYALNTKASLDSLFGTFNHATEKNVSENTSFQIVNTLAWERSEPLILNGLDINDITILNQNGQSVPVQKLKPGKFLIISGPVPPFSSQTYRIEPKESQILTKLEITPNRISNLYYSIEKESPDKLIIRDKRTSMEVFNISSDYCRYIKGLGVDSDTLAGKITGIEPGLTGPVMASFLVSMDVPGLRNFVIEVGLMDGIDQVEIINRFDKMRILDKEKVSFNFCFNVARSRTLYEIPWGTVDPSRNLLPGSNTGYYTVQHFADLSNESEGVTLVLADAPILQISKEKNGNGTIYESVVIDNGWHTNFPATQSGPMEFKYVIRTHTAFNLPETVKWGNAIFQPMISLLNSKIDMISPLKFIALGEAVTTSFRKDPINNGYLIRLYNPADRATVVNLEAKNSYHIWQKESESKVRKINGNNLNLLPKEVVTLQIKQK